MFHKIYKPATGIGLSTIASNLPDILYFPVEGNDYLENRYGKNIFNFFKDNKINSHETNPLSPYQSPALHPFKG